VAGRTCKARQCIRKIISRVTHGIPDDKQRQPYNRLQKKKEIRIKHWY